MQFNVGKCKVMHIGKKNRIYTYKMNGQKLEEVSIEKIWVYTSAMMLNHQYNKATQKQTEC